MEESRKYCKSCPYENNEPKIGVANEDKDVLIVMLCPGDDEKDSHKPLASAKGQSATQRIKKNLPEGKEIENYAVAELVRCYPGRDSRNCYKHPSSVGIALCCRYLEDLIVEKKYEKIISLTVEGNAIIENILSRHPEIKSRLVKGRHPRSGVSDKDLKEYLK